MNSRRAVSRWTPTRLERGLSQENGSLVVDPAPAHVEQPAERHEPEVMTYDKRALIVGDMQCKAPSAAPILRRYGPSP